MSTIEKLGPAEVFSLAEMLADEMEARGWTCVDVARRMPGDYAINVLIINFTLAITDEKLLLSDDTAEAFATAFGVSAEYIKNIHQMWGRWPDRRSPFECPEHLLDGMIFPTEH